MMGAHCLYLKEPLSLIHSISILILFQFPPIYYGDEAKIEKYTSQHVAVLMLAAFGLGFMFGVAIYFIVFIMCCLEPSSAFSEIDSEAALSTAAASAAFEDTRKTCSPTLSVHYV